MSKKTINLDALTIAVDKAQVGAVLDTYEPGLDAPLAEKQTWTKDQAFKIADQANHLKEKIDFYCQDNEYKIWIQTTAQSQLAVEWGVNQSSVSRLVGTVQKEFKEVVREQAISMRRDKKPINEIVQELPIEVSPKTVRRWCDADRKQSHPKKEDLVIDAEFEGTVYTTGVLETVSDKSKRLGTELRKATNEIELLKNQLNTALESVSYWKQKYQEEEDSI